MPSAQPQQVACNSSLLASWLPAVRNRCDRCRLRRAWVVVFDKRLRYNMENRLIVALVGSFFGIAMLLRYVPVSIESETVGKHTLT